MTEKIYDVKGLLLKYQEAIPQMNETNRQELVDLDMYLAKAATESAADNLLSVLEGFAPVENDAELCKEFDQMGVLYIKEEAVEDDNPPIRLKNGWFARLFEVLTGMYGMPVVACPLSLSAALAHKVYITSKNQYSAFNSSSKR